jgi:hypothetical protein
MVASRLSHHDLSDFIRKNNTKFKVHVAPGIALDDDPRSIAKGLTSKFKKLLSKIRMNSSVGPTGQRTRSRSPEAV